MNLLININENPITSNNDNITIITYVSTILKLSTYSESKKSYNAISNFFPLIIIS